MVFGVSVELLATYVLIANILDLQTTLDGLKLGLKEANPLANYILQTSGAQGLAAVKMAVPMVLITLAFLGVDSRLTKVLAGMGVVFSLAAINNTLLIMFKRR